jgi:branched-chain amino acid transport system substrate-binding protein
LLMVMAAVLSAAACGTRVSAPPTQTAGPAASPEAISTAGPENVASDIGISRTTITVGVLVSRTSPLGPEAFSGSYYGATAYFAALNKRGGINGRTVKVVACDDTGSGSGNVACAHTLLDRDRVFALAGTTAFNYDGASYVNQRGVPDVAGQPVGNDYDRFPHLWNLYGSNEPRNGKVIGWNGKLYGGTEVFRWFKERRGAKKAAVVFYNVAPSQRYAQLVEGALRTEGYTVRQEQVDLGLANFDSIAVDIGAAKVDTVFDALDTAGNIRLCKALDAHHVQLIAKVTTTQGWTGSVASGYAASPTCRNSLYATGNSQNFDDRSKPGVAAFQDAVDQLYPNRQGERSEWELEGYASAQWLSDAMASCGSQLTRVCVENFLKTTTNYIDHGLLTPRDFVVAKPGKTQHNCLNVARWQDSAKGRKGGWVSQVDDMNTNCFIVPELAYSP